MDYEEALELAMKKGYAEADPTADVEGYDAGRKIAIMASIAFNSRVTFSQVSTEGLTGITAKDIQYARDFGYVIKLLGLAGAGGSSSGVGEKLLQRGFRAGGRLRRGHVHGTGSGKDAHSQRGHGRCDRCDGKSCPWLLRADGMHLL